MKKPLLIFFSLITLTTFLSLTMAPPAFGDVEDDIRDQLKPIEDVYNPQGDVSPASFSKTIAELIKVALQFLGIIFLVLILYAGFLWLTSAGNEDKISKAKKIMAAAIIGSAIILTAYIITSFVLNQLLEATGVAY